MTLTTNDAYAKGALVLGSSLKQHRTTRRLVVLATPQVSDSMRWGPRCRPSIHRGSDILLPVSDIIGHWGHALFRSWARGREKWEMLSEGLLDLKPPPSFWEIFQLNSLLEGGVLAHTFWFQLGVEEGVVFLHSIPSGWSEGVCPALPTYMHLYAVTIHGHSFPRMEQGLHCFTLQTRETLGWLRKVVTLSIASWHL